MELKQVFINSAGRLRSGWRLLIFVLVYFVVFLLISTIARAGLRRDHHAGAELSFWKLPRELLFPVVAFDCCPGSRIYLRALARRFAVALSGLMAARRLVARSARRISYWYRFVARRCGDRDCGRRFEFQLRGPRCRSQVAQTLIFSAALFILAALAEEALFRGYPLQTTARARLAWLGVFLTSVPFAAAHLRNPNVAAGFTFINTALAGVWLAVAYLRTRSLWFPLGVHWAWNWALGSLFGLPVSGITDLAPHPLLRGTDLGPAWLTGGSYGIEGGLACTITLALSTLFIWRTRLVSADPEMKTLTSQENPVSGPTNFSLSSSQPVTAPE